MAEATALSYIIDEMRETTNLLRVQETLQEGHRPWWRNFVFAFIRVGREANADLAVQYLGENIDRARDHWREALRLIDQLLDDDFGELLSHELNDAGVRSVMPRLAHDQIPGPRKEAAAHLADVVSTIRGCTQIVVNARNQLTLRKMRENPEG
jgi:hypothetical protein